MKKRAIVLFAATAMFSVSIQSAAIAQKSGSANSASSATSTAPSFEGTMVWAMMNPAQLGDSARHNMTINMKGEKTMVEMDAGMQGTVHIYGDKVAKKMTVVMVDANMGMEQPLPDEEKVEATAVKAEPDIKPTGKKTTIAGRNAEEYTLKGEGPANVSIWMTSEIAPEMREAFKAASGRAMKGSKKQKAAFKQFAEKGLFPVKIEAKGAAGETTTLEFVSLDAKKLDDSVFEVPKDVQITPMPKSAN